MVWTPGVTTGATMATDFNTLDADFDALLAGFVESAQDAVGAMVDASLIYVDATPLFQRAALNGAITAAAGSNATALGSFTTAELNAALSDNDVSVLAANVYTGLQTIPRLNLGLQSIATAAGTTTLTASSPYHTIFTGATTQTCVLPDATTLTVGHRFKISNNSTGAVTVQQNGGATLWVIAGGNTDLDLVLTDNSTAAGTWGFDYRVGKSASGKASIFNNSFTFNGTDGTTFTFPSTSGNIPIMGGSAAQMLYNNAGSIAGAANALIEGNELRLPSVSTPTAPTSGGAKIYGKSVGGQTLPAYLSPAGREQIIASWRGRGRKKEVRSPGNNASTQTLGIILSTTGTATGVANAATSRYTRMDITEYLVTVAATTAVAGARSASTQLTVGGSTAGDGGFLMSFVWAPATGLTNASHRAFAGLRGSVAAPTDVNPSTLTDIIGMGWDAADTQVQFMYNDATGTASKVALGASFPKPSADRSKVYEIVLYAPPGSTQSVSYEITDLTTGAVATGTVTTDIPAVGTFLGVQGYTSVGGVSSVTGFGISSLTIEGDY